MFSSIHYHLDVREGENSEHTLGVQSKDTSVFEYSDTLCEILENHRKQKANRMSYFVVHI